MRRSLASPAQIKTKTMTTLATRSLSDLDLLHAQRALTEAMGALTALSIAVRRVAPDAQGGFRSFDRYRAHRDAQTLLVAWSQVAAALAR